MKENNNMVIDGGNNMDDNSKLNELSQKEKELTVLEKNIEEQLNMLNKEKENWYSTRENRLNDLAEELAIKRETKERELTIRLDKIKEDVESELHRKKELVNSEIIQEKENLEKEKSQFEQAKEKFLQEKRSFDREKNRFSAQENNLEERIDNLEKEISNRISEKETQFQSELARKDEIIQHMLQKQNKLAEEIKKYSEFEELYGNSPDKIKKDISSLNACISELKKKIASLPPKEIEIEYDAKVNELSALLGKYQQIENENISLKTKLLDSSREQMELKIHELEAEKCNLENEVRTLEKKNESLQTNLNRLAKPEMQKEQIQSRLDEIRNLSYFNNNIKYVLRNDEDEILWLNDIYERCESFKFHFNKRILYAFHTALKISDWSIITVLAGVSGTGKSKLPELYSAFGGINFINIPVQPSWDSQESMLGYFNSIDNRFQAEPLLKFLIQCTETEPYNEFMSIVLLDEMNLAHIEHYFADFLSKLEERRIKDKNNLPKIEIKLGSQCPSHFLDLVRSILWVGTMNQDETTKSLSDKVIDRGLIINFPRPNSLVTMNKNETISKLIQVKQNDSTIQYMTPKKTWMKWVVRDISNTSNEIKNQLEKYKSIVQKVNEYLEPVGRAMGHRVWQSIEYYIYNYPTVRSIMTNSSDGSLSNDLSKEMQIAFEDQIVQKVMPKLRGIEDRSIGKICLDKIQDLLETEGLGTLTPDFKTAREQGYGQFIWSSAKYLSENRD